MTRTRCKWMNKYTKERHVITVSPITVWNLYDLMLSHDLYGKNIRNQLRQISFEIDLSTSERIIDERERKNERKKKRGRGRERESTEE